MKTIKDFDFKNKKAEPRDLFLSYQGDTVLVEFFAESAGDTLELASLALNVNITN